MGTLSDVKDIAVLGLLGVGAYLVFDTLRGGNIARKTGETATEGILKATGGIISGALASTQSLLTGEPTEDIYARVKRGAQLAIERNLITELRTAVSDAGTFINNTVGGLISPRTYPHFGAGQGWGGGGGGSRNG